MSAKLYHSSPTSNDLLARLIAEQTAMTYQVIDCGANDAKNIENRQQSPVQQFECLIEE